QLKLKGWENVVYAHLSPSHLRDLGMFRENAIERKLDEHIRGLNNHETKIWTLLTFCIWHQRNIRTSSIS
ncbi:MAG: hypothetical protein KJS98_18020, partial [Nitrospirae bacterium]|nr:hypothetical protein [Nitrospirota bacterium]